mmetsp:Transcript_135511/g.432496  ORF Transcript_135511/g.432496 Transcript_135511/m.432496 type:complete len:970 (-) Transcript_135511:418-3327(-)
MPVMVEPVEVEGGADFDDFNFFKVQLKKETSSRLGLAYRARKEGLVITAIVHGSSADTWNRIADIDRVICVGDVIVACNDQEINMDATSVEDCNGEAVVKCMRKPAEVHVLRIEKTGPRWHILGDTAGCIEKMNFLADQGVFLEFVQGDATGVDDDTLVNQSELKMLTRNQKVIVFFTVLTPNALTIILWSAMGAGFSLFGTLFPGTNNMLGDLLVFLATIIVLNMYLVDWHKWESNARRVITLLVVIYMGCLGGILKCRFYPQAPLVISLFHVPVLIGVLRATALKQCHRGSFYRAVGQCGLIVGVGIMILWLAWMTLEAWDGDWKYTDATKDRLVERSADLYAAVELNFEGTTRSLNYKLDCKQVPTHNFKFVYGQPVETIYEYTPNDKKLIGKNCSSVKTVWFLLWASPCVCALVTGILAAFCAIHGTMKESSDISRAEKASKQFFMMVGVLVMCMWVAASIASASMRLTGTIFSFCGAGLVALFAWWYLEIGPKVINSSLKYSKFTGQLMSVFQNDWFRACVVCGFNVTLPAWFAIEVVRAKVRRLRKTTTSKSWTTTEAQLAWGFLEEWQWASIFMKVNLLCMLYWGMSIGVAKITVVFLAWLNEALASWSYLAVNIALFLIAEFLMMLPPTPGIPVYIIMGIILAGQGRKVEGVGYGGGLIIGIVSAFLVKEVSVVGQYAIGFFMGKSVKIQQLVGVDKVPIRAVEKIMQSKQVIGKVAVLVGGPDWPTNCLCGVLRLSLWTCVWGTIPVITIIGACVMAGAFLAGPKEIMTDTEKSMWSAVANTALVLSGVVQMVAGVIAMYYIQGVVSKDGEELAKPRPEHEPVYQLTLAEEAFRETHAEVLRWDSLPRPWLLLIAVSASMMVGSIFVFQFMDSLCFVDFQVNDRVSDPEGLNCGSNLGCAIFRLVNGDTPIGWSALGIFFFACFLHFNFSSYVVRVAKKRLAAKSADLPAFEEFPTNAGP